MPPRRTRCSPGDFARLEAVLAGKPDEVLSWFETLGIGCLMELDTFRTLQARRPETAARIAHVAATVGIPLTCDAQTKGRT